VSPSTSSVMSMEPLNVPLRPRVELFAIPPGHERDFANIPNAIWDPTPPATAPAGPERMSDSAGAELVIPSMVFAGVGIGLLLAGPGGWTLLGAITLTGGSLFGVGYGAWELSTADTRTPEQEAEVFHRGEALAATLSTPVGIAAGLVIGIPAGIESGDPAQGLAVGTTAGQIGSLVEGGVGLAVGGVRLARSGVGLVQEWTAARASARNLASRVAELELVGPSITVPGPTAVHEVGATPEQLERLRVASGGDVEWFPADPDLVEAHFRSMERNPMVWYARPADEAQGAIGYRNGLTMRPRGGGPLLYVFGEVHHFAFPRAVYGELVMEPTNLYMTFESTHMDIHSAFGGTTGMNWEGIMGAERDVQNMFNFWIHSPR
jgi:hypothetical protein